MLAFPKREIAHQRGYGAASGSCVGKSTEPNLYSFSAPDTSYNANVASGNRFQMAKSSAVIVTHPNRTCSGQDPARFQLASS
jgi:hypothetical protein